MMSYKRVVKFKASWLYVVPYRTAGHEQTVILLTDMVVEDYELTCRISEYAEINLFGCSIVIISCRSGMPKHHNLLEAFAL